MKLYTNKEWLEWAYYTMKYTPDEIAQKTNAGTSTIYRYLKQFNIIK